MIDTPAWRGGLQPRKSGTRKVQILAMYVSCLYSGAGEQEVRQRTRNNSGCMYVPVVERMPVPPP